MNRSALTRQIFVELRRAFGPEVPTRHVARLARAIVQSYTEDRDELVDFGTQRETRSLLSMPVDIAFELGWRLHRFELDLARGTDSGPESDRFTVRPLIEKYLGPEWQHQQVTELFSQ